LPLPIRASIPVVLVPILAFGGTSLRQIWEVRPAEKLAEPAGWTVARSHPVLELAFSPDGSKLAATMDDHYDAGGFKTHLLILDVQDPRKIFRQFDLETCGKFLAWAPDGNALLICGKVLRLDDRSSCDVWRTSFERVPSLVLNGSYWLGKGLVIRGDRTTTDLSCRPLGTWEIEGKWAVRATAPAKGWMLLAQSVQRTIDGKTLSYKNYAIADRDSHALTSGIFLADSYGDADIAPGAAAVCSSVIHPGQDKPALRCWNLPDGGVLPNTNELADYVITRASIDSPVVVAERWGYHALNLLKIIPDKLNVIVVDVRSGHRLASLKPRTQHGDYVSKSDIRSQYFQYALSPKGDLLAEGGDGELRLFQLQ
jgi:WD40 repeat protein